MCRFHVGNGEVTFQEFCEVMKERLKENEQDLRDAFKVREIIKMHWMPGVLYAHFMPFLGRNDFLISMICLSFVAF